MFLCQASSSPEKFLHLGLSISQHFLDRRHCVFQVVHLSVCPILLSTISQEHLKGISSNFTKMSSWTEGWNYSISVVKVQAHCAFKCILFLVTWHLMNAWRGFHYICHKRPHDLKYELIRICWSKVEDQDHFLCHKLMIYMLIMTKFLINVFKLTWLWCNNTVTQDQKGQLWPIWSDTRLVMLICGVLLETVVKIDDFNITHADL